MEPLEGVSVCCAAHRAAARVRAADPRGHTRLTVLGSSHTGSRGWPEQRAFRFKDLLCEIPFRLSFPGRKRGISLRKAPSSLFISTTAHDSQQKRPAARAELAPRQGAAGGGASSVPSSSLAVSRGAHCTICGCWVAREMAGVRRMRNRERNFANRRARLDIRLRRGQSLPKRPSGFASSEG